MKDRVKKKDSPLSGVKCIVNSCHYYIHGDHCGADRIEIQPRNASTSEDTDCATFIPH